MYYSFLRSICRLHQSGDTAKLASLRRAAGELLGSETARNVYWVYSYLTTKEGQRLRENDEQTRFLIGTLLAFDRKALDHKPNSLESPFSKNGISLAFTLRRLTGLGEGAKDDEIEKHPLTRRFRILLDADYSIEGDSALPFRLRQIVRYALQKEATINWDQLLYDVNCWNHPDRFVQEQWARDYFAPYSPADTTDTQSDAE